MPVILKTALDDIEEVIQITGDAEMPPQSHPGVGQPVASLCQLHSNVSTPVQRQAWNSWAAGNLSSRNATSSTVLDESNLGVAPALSIAHLAGRRDLRLAIDNNGFLPCRETA